MPYKPIGDWKVRHLIWVAVVFGMFAVALIWFLWDPLADKASVADPHETAAPSTK